MYEGVNGDESTLADGGGVVSFVKTSPQMMDTLEVDKTPSAAAAAAAAAATTTRAAAREENDDDEGDGGGGDGRATDTRRAPWYIHTLNTTTGLLRKLESLGIID